MPTLEYRGDYGSSVTLSTTRTTSLAINGTIPSTPILVSSAYARIYVSTTAKPYTYQFQVTTNNGYTGTLSYNFSANDTPVYVDVPITVEPLDYNFPTKTIDTISVIDNSGHGASVRIRGLVRIFVEYVNVSAPTQPDNVRINGETAINLEAEHTATLTWDASTPSEYDTTPAYRIRYVNNGTSTILGTTSDLSYTITAPNTDSQSYVFHVDVLTANWYLAGTNTASIYTFIQLTAPTFLYNDTYKLRPMLLVTLGNGPSNQNLTILASGWTASRQALPGEHVYLKRDSAYTDSDFYNLWAGESDYSFEYMQFVFAEYSAGTYTISAIVTSSTSSALVEFRNGTSVVGYTTVASGTEQAYSTVTLSGDCDRIVLYSASTDGLSQGVSAEWKKIMLLSGDTEKPFAPHGAVVETVTVTETDELMRSIETEVTVTYTPRTYTVDPVIACETIVRATDITSLQTGLNTIRIRYGMSTYTFTPCYAGITSLTLWPTHISEIQDCITEIQTYVNAWDSESISYSIILPTMLISQGPSAAVINQLRKIITLL